MMSPEYAARVTIDERHIGQATDGLSAEAEYRGGARQRGRKDIFHNGAPCCRSWAFKRRSRRNGVKAAGPLVDRPGHRLRQGDGGWRGRLGAAAGPVDGTRPRL